MRRLRAIALALALGAVPFFSCVCPTPIIGEACTQSSSCPQGTVCEAIDPERPAAAANCLPMPKLDAVPVHCAAALDCSKAGYPVDATCANGSCTCDDAVLQNCEVTIAANDAHRQTCTCPPPPPDAGEEGEGEGE